MEAYLLTVAVFALIYALMTLALNLQFGFAGLINFGLVGSFAIGAYACALLGKLGLSVLLTLPLAALISALASWPIGLLSLRLRVEYFAIATLGFAETVRLVINQEQWLTGGAQGIAGIPGLGKALGIAAPPTSISFIVSLLAVVAVVLICWKLVYSPFGRIIRAIRDDEDAVRALGKSPANFKVKIFVLSSAFVGFSGGLYAHFLTYISPDQFIALTTFYIWVAMILGGAGSVTGSVIGSFLLMFFVEAPQFLPNSMFGLSAVALSSLRLGVIGLALILLMRFKPEGIMGGGLPS